MTQLHIRVLLQQTAPIPNVAGIAIQLTAALEGPLLLCLSRPETGADEAAEAYAFLGGAWQTLIERLTR